MLVRSIDWKSSYCFTQVQIRQGYPVWHSGVREIDGLASVAVVSGEPPSHGCFVEQVDVDGEVDYVVPELESSDVERLSVFHQPRTDDLRNFHILHVKNLFTI